MPVPRVRVGALVAVLATVLAYGCGGSGSSRSDGGGPDAGECNEDQVRPCERANDFGICLGEQRCRDGTFDECDAPEAALEICNGIDDDCDGNVDEDSIPGSPACTPEGSECPGRLECKDGELECVDLGSSDEICDRIDNDCDGQVDEGFRRADGTYASPEHCGSCDNDCSDAYPTAVEVDCEVLRSGPRCVATVCPAGTSLAPGGLGCIALTTRLCESCSTDDDCSTAVGDRCLTYPDGSFCGRDCTGDSVFGTECPRGFFCSAGQCRLPPGSTCLCDPDDSFDKPCDFENPDVPDRICAGIEVCDRGAFGACTAPTEACNGIDDDCNGEVDEGFVDPESGEYSVDPRHCGACGVDCVALFSNPGVNAVGQCSEDLRCVPGCVEGFGDANGEAADGCECTILSEQDPPDTMGVDANCDGVDGEVSRAVFVSPTGSDSNPGTREQPLRTIGRGIELAQNFPNRDHVYVAEGIYDEAIQLTSGVSLFGGYSPDFSRHDTLGQTSVIVGATPTANRLGTINATGIVLETIVEGFAIRASKQPTPAGNTYAVHVRDSGSALILRNNRIVAANGAPGEKGPDGADGADATAMPGSGDDASTANAQQCTTETVAGGTGASWECPVQGQPGMIDTSGGNGGTSDCPVDSEAEASGQPGSPSGAPGGNGGYGSFLVDLSSSSDGCAVRIPRSPPAPAGATEDGLPGTDGPAGIDGAAGNACAATRGSIVGGEWANAAAGAGTGAQPGNGGGGGGAAGGVEIGGPYSLCIDGNELFTEALGGGGGGGGAGGCGGFGGQPGGSGGGSFGVFVVFAGTPSSLPTLESNDIVRAFGGAGAEGGAGGQPGLGSIGALGGVGDPSATGAESLLEFIENGGRGGDGGRGGFGGGAGGGCGGASVGVFFSSVGSLSTAAIVASNSFIATGAAGAGGDGGPSGASPGPNGATGLYAEVSP